jgi:hypothetical protein
MQTGQSISEVVERRLLSGRGMGGGGVRIIGSHCIAMPSEDIEGLACAVVKCKVCELVKLFVLLVVMCHVVQ